jgi:hypothetical protein
VSLYVALRRFSYSKVREVPEWEDPSGDSRPAAAGSKIRAMADVATTGVLEGKTIRLDDSVPPLEGKRVRVVIAPEEDEPQLSADEQARLWHQWVEHGPQGPIEDDGEPEFP